MLLWTFLLCSSQCVELDRIACIERGKSGKKDFHSNHNIISRSDGSLVAYLHSLSIAICSFYLILCSKPNTLLHTTS